MSDQAKLPYYWLAVALLFALGTWYWARTVLIPSSTTDALVAGRPIGNNSDLYPRWLGARELLLHGRNPYSDEVTREIQQGYYGRALDPQHPADPRDQVGFAYPLYVVFLLAPVLHVPFSVVQSGFGWLLLLLTAASVPLWLRALNLRPHPALTVAGILLVLGSYPFIQGFYLQQLSLLVAFLLAAACAAIAAGWLLVGGPCWHWLPSSRSWSLCSCFGSGSGPRATGQNGNGLPGVSPLPWLCF